MARKACLFSVLFLCKGEAQEEIQRRRSTWRDDEASRPTREEGSVSSLTVFIFHGTTQMTLRGIMRIKQRGNEQRWVAWRKSLPHIISLHYTPWGAAERCLQSRQKALNGRVESEFPLVSLHRPVTRWIKYVWPPSLWSFVEEENLCACLPSVGAEAFCQFEFYREPSPSAPTDTRHKTIIWRRRGTRKRGRGWAVCVPLNKTSVVCLSVSESNEPETQMREKDASTNDGEWPFNGETPPEPGTQTFVIDEREPHLEPTDRSQSGSPWTQETLSAIVCKS